MSIRTIHISLCTVIMMMIVLPSCKPESKSADKATPEQALYHEVIYIHDEVMPKMADIHRLKKSLRPLVKTSKDSLMIQQMITDLAKADEEMMSWMADFGPAYEKTTDDLKMSFLTEEKTKIQHVSDVMLSSIDKAQKYLKNLYK